MKTFKAGMHHYLVNGYKVQFENGLAEFTQYGVCIKVDAQDFTYDWATKIAYKLSVLQGRVA